MEVAKNKSIESGKRFCDQNVKPGTTVWPPNIVYIYQNVYAKIGLLYLLKH